MAGVEILVVATEVAREVVKVLVREAVKVAVETDAVMVEVTGAELVAAGPVAADLEGGALDSDPVAVVLAEAVALEAVALAEVDQEEAVDLAVETEVVAATLY